MPIYEYECRECDHRFELLVLGSETPACPECESTKLDRAEVRHPSLRPGIPANEGVWGKIRPTAALDA